MRAGAGAAAAVLAQHAWPHWRGSEPPTLAGGPRSTAQGADSQAEDAAEDDMVLGAAKCP